MSCEVATCTASEPAVTGPIVKPVRVTENTDEGTAAAAVVMTKKVLPMLTDPESPGTFEADTIGEILASKNCGGY
jgi:hypothetical protein